MISPSKATIFIGAPHTGSTTIHAYAHRFSISHNLYVVEKKYKHADLKTALEYITKNNITYPYDKRWNVIVFERDLFEKIESTYFLLQRESQRLINARFDYRKLDHSDWGKRVLDFYSKNISLDDYARWRVYLTLKNPTDLLLGGKRWFNTNKIKTNQIILSYDEYDKSFCVVCEHLGIPYQTPNVINSRLDEQNQHISDDILTRCKQQIERYYGKRQHFRF